MSDSSEPNNSPKRVADCELKDTVYEAPSGIHGRGLFACRAIEKGEYIGTFHGPKVSENGHHVLWVYESDDDDEPVGHDGKNLLRFLNHSDEYNAEFDGLDLYALRSIEQDEEITFDYGW